MIRIIFTMICAWWPGPLLSSNRWNVADTQRKYVCMDLKFAAFVINFCSQCSASFRPPCSLGEGCCCCSQLIRIGHVSPLTARQRPWPSCADHRENDPNHVVLPLMDLINLLHSKNILRLLLPLYFLVYYVLLKNLVKIIHFFTPTPRWLMIGKNNV